jgi:N-acetylglucosaminyldiphosphoundecaprenol N-acetyl-beta-D-mannosaminyltransferase
LAKSAEVVETINAAKPDILAVGMASPRQEFWLADHGAKLDVPVRWCVGALFDYLAGTERRAPAWLCRVGGEWMYRLAMDPLGKWRRYLLGNPRFVWNTLRWRTRRRRSGERREALSTTQA